jgi:hypothetical protein
VKKAAPLTRSKIEAEQGPLRANKRLSSLRKQPAKAKPAPAKKKPASRQSAKVKGRPTGGVANSRAMRWSLNFAAQEFGIDRNVVDRSRRHLGIEPGADGMFSTKQICAMIFGDKQLADAKRAEADAESAIRRNQREAGELIPTSVAVALVEPIMVVVRQKICALPISDAEKDDVLADLFAAKDLDWAKAAREAMK